MSYTADWESRIDVETMRKWRTQKFVETLRQSDLDAVLLGRADNVRYITSYKGVTGLFSWYWKQAVLLSRDGQPILFTPSYQVEDRRACMPWLPREDIRPLPWGLEMAGTAETAAKKTLAEVFKEKGLSKGSKLGVDNLPISLHKAMERVFPDLQLVDANALSMKARMIKHQEEIRCTKVAKVLPTEV